MTLGLSPTLVLLPNGRITMNKLDTSITCRENYMDFAALLAVEYLY